MKKILGTILIIIPIGFILKGFIQYPFVLNDFIPLFNSTLMVSSIFWGIYLTI